MPAGEPPAGDREAYRRFVDPWRRLDGRWRLRALQTTVIGRHPQLSR